MAKAKEIKVGDSFIFGCTVEKVEKHTTPKGKEKINLWVRKVFPSTMVGKLVKQSYDPNFNLIAYRGPKRKEI